MKPWTICVGKEFLLSAFCKKIALNILDSRSVWSDGHGLSDTLNPQGLRWNFDLQILLFDIGSNLEWGPLIGSKIFTGSTEPFEPILTKALIRQANF